MKSKAIFTLIVICTSVIILAGKCDSYTCPSDPVINVDSSHAMFSPVATRLFLQLHQSDSCKEKGNVKLFAQYTPNDYSKDTLAFLHEGTIVVLRDDGVYPDQKKDDQEYTAILKFDTAQLRVFYGNDAASTKGKGDAAFINFTGREVMSTEIADARTLSNRFDFDSFAQGKKVELQNNFPSLSEIRNKSIYIIDLNVVEDPTRTLLNRPSNPDGNWTFKKIMQGLANTAATGISVEDFTLNWLESWKKDFTVNGDLLRAKPGIQTFINAWPKLGNGKLDLNKSPFKLLAIVNRIDLMENPVYSTAKNGGELRFVFGMMQNNNPQSGVIIFEFGVPKTGKELQEYAGKWTQLASLNPGDAAYNKLLQEITDEIIGVNANTAKPNGSNLNQLRTDEISFGGGWELREFNINGSTHLLQNVTVKQEPAGKFNTDAVLQAVLTKYTSEFEKEIEQNRYHIPEQYDGTAFLGGKSDFPNRGVWGDAQGNVIKSDKARFVLSLNTCSGCHLQEVLTPGFLHDQPAGFGSTTSLSGFIRGKDFSKPLGTNTDHFEVTDIRGNKHTFNDLARRAKLLWAFTNSHPTLFGLQFNPVNMEH